MATVTTPSGDVLEGVSGAVLDYYRGLAANGEAYVVTEDAAGAPVVFPVVYYTPDVPAKSATKPELAGYLVDAGLSEQSVEALVEEFTHDELVDLVAAGEPVPVSEPAAAES